MTTVFISDKGKSFLKKKYSGKVVEQLVRNAKLLRDNGSITMKIDGKELIIKAATAKPA
jgi:hypothetical protein